LSPDRVHTTYVAYFGAYLSLAIDFKARKSSLPVPRTGNPSTQTKSSGDGSQSFGNDPAARALQTSVGDVSKLVCTTINRSCLLGSGMAVTPTAGASTSLSPAASTIAASTPSWGTISPPILEN